MNNIIFKIAPKGEGKTKWLLEIANKYADRRQIYIYIDDDIEYRKFCEKYFKLYNRVCPADRLTTLDQSKDAVVLVDNLFNQDSSISDFTFIHNNCYKLFIALEGTVEEEENEFC